MLFVIGSTVCVSLLCVISFVYIWYIHMSTIILFLLFFLCAGEVDIIDDDELMIVEMMEKEAMGATINVDKGSQLFFRLLVVILWKIHLNLSVIFVAGCPDYATPAMTVNHNIGVSCSATPKSFLRKARVIQPSKALLPPFVAISATKSESDLYCQIIKHHSKSDASKIKK